MRLYFNGCSFTQGDELSDPMSSYPTVMSRKLGLEFTNDAQNGGSNQRIVYKTMQAIDDHDCFIIAWTSYNRFTEYNPVDNFEINFFPQMSLDATSHYSDDLKVNYAKYLDYGNMYYKYWQNELYEFKQWLQQILLLQSFLKCQNKKYIMLNTMDNRLEQWCSAKEEFLSSVRPLLPFFDYLSDELLLEEHRQIQNLLSMIDHSTYLGFGKWCIVDYTRQFPCGPNGHPLEDGHIAVADTLIKFYNKTVCSN